MKNKNRIIKIRINGDTWKVHVLSEAAYYYQTKTIPGESLGITMYNHDTGDRDIYLRRKHCTFDTIMHELLHAYFSYKNFANKGYGTIEEEVCEFLPKRINAILRAVRRIKASLKK